MTYEITVYNCHIQYIDLFVEELEKIGFIKTIFRELIIISGKDGNISALIHTGKEEDSRYLIKTNNSDIASFMTPIFDRQDITINI